MHLFEEKLYNDNITLEFYKEKKCLLIKMFAEQRLKNTDWMCIRHRDQKDNVDDTPTLTNQQYKDLLDSRKAIRDYSGSLETLINACETKEAVAAVQWVDGDI